MSAFSNTPQRFPRFGGAQKNLEIALVSSWRVSLAQPAARRQGYGPPSL